MLISKNALTVFGCFLVEVAVENGKSSLQHACSLVHVKYQVYCVKIDLCMIERKSVLIFILTYIIYSQYMDRKQY